jgi:hypothetical protein
MGRESRTGFMAVAADDVERTSRKAGGLSCAGDEGVAQRVEFRCLDHTGIASSQGCRQRSCGHLQRIVPGDHLRRDAIGFVHGEIEITVAQRDRPSFDGLGLVAVIFEIARRPLDLDACLPERFAAFQRQDRRDLVDPGEKIIPHRAHHAAALDRPERRQRAAYVAGAGGGHRPVHVARIGEGLLGQGFAGRGIIDDEPARAAIDEVSIDEVLPVAGNLISAIDGLPHPVLQGHHRMLGIQPAFRIDDQRTGLVAAALQSALHRFDETNVFFHRGGERSWTASLRTTSESTPSIVYQPRQTTT